MLRAELYVRIVYKIVLSLLTIFAYMFLALEAPPTINPCQPSPCGPNSECREINNSPSCSCLANFIGSPPNCRPECVSNSECASHLACINNKCADPCPGICGQNAECRVVSHTPNCVCLSGYTGNPFVQCLLNPRNATLFITYFCVLLTIIVF